MDNIIMMARAISETLMASDDLFQQAMGQRIQQYLESPSGVDFAEVIDDLKDDTIYWLEEDIAAAGDDAPDWMISALEQATM